MMYYDLIHTFPFFVFSFYNISIRRVIVMKNKNICKIVEDLLPAYIDALLSEESKKLVEEHLETCETCQKAYSQMTSDIQKEVIQNTENVKTIKKYRRKQHLKISITQVLVPISE